MKKTRSFLLIITVLILSLTLIGCGSVSPAEGEYTRVAVDISSNDGSSDICASVEFMVDDNGKVASATALNEDGAILLAGESFEGETPSEAIRHVVQDAIDIGYLIKDIASMDGNDVAIIVSGVSEYAKGLGLELIESAKTALAEFDVLGRVEAAKTVTVEELRRMVNDCGLYTEEEVAEMNVGRLLAALAESRKYASPLMTDELRAAYKSSRDHEISLAKSNAVAGVIGGLGSAYDATHAAYCAAVDAYGSAVAAIDNFNYSTFIAPDSAYQSALGTLNSAKANYVSIRSFVAGLSAEDRVALEAELAAAEQTYNQAVVTLEQVSSTANTSLSSLIDELNKAEAKLDEVEAQLFNHDIEAAIQNKAGEIDASMNAAKDAFFADFEAKYRDDINGAVESLTATKKAVVAKMDEASAAIKSATDSFGAKVDELYGDEIDYVKSAIKSATDKIWEEIQKIPLPLP